MTLEEIRAQSRRYARITSGSANDSQVNFLIREGIKTFAVDVSGFPKEEYISLSAKFDTRTNMAIRVTITGGTNALTATDVVITATNRTDATGDQVATDLQSQLRSAIGAGANATVVWTEWYFTVDTVDGTAITIESPSSDIYVDATELLGLSGTETGTAVSFTGDFPEDCTVEADLPADIITIENVEWDNIRLLPTTRDMVISPQATGIPAWYQVRGDTIRLFPVPTSQDEFHIEYRGYGTMPVLQGYQECGLSGIAGNVATGLSASTAYSFKVSIDGGASTEYDITTATDVTYTAVIALMNAAVTGATFSLVGGDLRCTSDTVTYPSTIDLAAATVGTDLIGALTGFSAYETAVDADNAITDIPEEYHMALTWWVASQLLYEQFDTDLANKALGQYMRIKNQYVVQYHNRTPKMDSGVDPREMLWILRVND